MVSEVWLIDDASGPVQLHRSAIVTVPDELAAPAGAAGVTATLTAPATPSEPIASVAAIFFTRTNTCTPLAPRPSQTASFGTVATLIPVRCSERALTHRFPGLYRPLSVLSRHSNLVVEDVSMAMGSGQRDQRAR